MAEPDEAPKPPAPAILSLKVIVTQTAQPGGDVTTNIQSTSQSPMAMLIALNDAANILLHGLVKANATAQTASPEGKSSAKPRLWVPDGNMGGAN